MATLAGALTGLGLLALPAVPSPAYYATVAATDTWSLSITGSEGKEEGELVAIQNADGEWVTPQAGEAVQIIKRRQPESPIAVVIRMRLAAGARPEAAREVKLVVAAAEGSRER